MAIDQTGLFQWGRHFLSALILASMVSACDFIGNNEESQTSSSEPAYQPEANPELKWHHNPNNRNLSESFLELFEGPIDPEKWYRSDFTVRGGNFLNSWRPENVDRTSTGVDFYLKRENFDGMEFSGAEIQRRAWTQYGRFETIMRAAPGSGTALGFFTHTDSFFKDPHEEIDIEWLGRDENLVQLNVFAGNGPEGSWKYRMPFDVTSEFHHYAFEWTPTEIVWFIDGQEIFRVTDQQMDIPDTPQRYIVHLWTGKFLAWHGKPDFRFETYATVRCLSYQKLDEYDQPSCSDHMDLARDARTDGFEVTLISGPEGPGG